MKSDLSLNFRYKIPGDACGRHLSGDSGSRSHMPVTRPFLSREVLLPVQPCLHSAVRGCGRPVDDPREARSNDRAGRRDLEPPVRFRGSPVFKTGPLPVVASQRNTQDGGRTRKPARAHESESCTFTKISPPGHKVQEEGVEPSGFCV